MKKNVGQHDRNPDLEAIDEILEMARSATGKMVEKRSPKVTPAVVKEAEAEDELREDWADAKADKSVTPAERVRAADAATAVAEGEADKALEDRKAKREGMGLLDHADPSKNGDDETLRKQQALNTMLRASRDKASALADDDSEWARKAVEKYQAKRK